MIDRTVTRNGHGNGNGNGNGNGVAHHAMIGTHPLMERLRSAIRRAAPLDTPVLLQGPTGSGKELAAELLHSASGRKGKLVAVNVGAIPEHLAEAELFGCVRGAFTGAHKDRIGLIEEASEGTLYLDEAGELSLATQVKLLRVLETGWVRPVGGTGGRHVTFRLVTSVQERALSLVAAGRWRRDFHYRAAGFCFDIPGLAEHSSDIPLLVDCFLERLGQPPLPRDGVERLSEYGWPGNVRELRLAVERALFLAGAGEPVTPSLILSAVDSWVDQPNRVERRADDRSLRDVDREHIEEVLRDCGYSTRAAAAVLRLSLQQLYRRFEALGIIAPRRRGRERASGEHSNPDRASDDAGYSTREPSVTNVRIREIEDSEFSNPQIRRAARVRGK